MAAGGRQDAARCRHTPWLTRRHAALRRCRQTPLPQPPCQRPPTCHGYIAEESAATKEYAQEQKKAASHCGSRAEKEVAAERDMLAKIGEMPKVDRVLAERIHAPAEKPSGSLA